MSLRNARIRRLRSGLLKSLRRRLFSHTAISGGQSGKRSPDFGDNLGDLRSQCDTDEACPKPFNRLVAGFKLELSSLKFKRLPEDSNRLGSLKAYRNFLHVNFACKVHNVYIVCLFGDDARCPFKIASMIEALS